ncbi:DUF1636 domain-containing protein [Notoacmeibacter ruber]|uniref:DUF1636 domain-containing protein n=1 Tax=Notoacmeibacter ruber TaxID=2670375 RepID=A0A3L7JFT9_9HYPH|nr:DUF1636 family protein [Notoacmeibacter ruber]RLQ89637.1 DUF1636 domain-containing protein [Notoacmeibacter ruber]
MSESDPANSIETGKRDVVVLVCRTCKGPSWTEGEVRPGALLADSAIAMSEREPAEHRIAMETVECLGNCSRGCSAAILSPGDWQYVFGDLTVESAADLMTGARLMGSVAEGPLPWRGRPSSLKKGMVARIPPVQAFAGSDRGPNGQ